jgi:Ca-activated chloride channel family protein
MPSQTARPVPGLPSFLLHFLRDITQGCALALALAAPGAAQEPVPVPEARIRVDVDLVVVEAAVKDKSGRVMGQLRKDDFRLFEDGVEQEIVHFSRDQFPLAVALVVDVSPSTEPYFRELRRATLTALRALKPDDQAALFLFSGNVRRAVDLTRDRLEVSDRLERLEAGRGTNINSAVYQAANYVRRAAPEARRAVVLVSDNVGTFPGHVDHDEVVEAALEAGVSVYSLRIPGRNPPLTGLFRRTVLRGVVDVKKLVAETGGELVDVQKERSLPQAFQELVDRLKTRYALGYYPTNRSRDGRFRRVEVRLHPTWGAKDVHYTVAARRGYYAQSSATASR